jgi:acyl-[acyl-carrier-protein]-phospholipid O-acyltransferase/long-chain-fatty-acid--[acyl-carrier-protein] ligase
LKSDSRLWVGGFAVSFFWMTGAVALSLVPVIVKTRVGGGVDVQTAVSALFAIGVAAGSVLAAALSRGRIALLPTPVAGLLMAAFLIDLGLAANGPSMAGAPVALRGFLASGAGVRLSVDVVALAAAGGLFVVPVFAAVQSWAGEDRRARVVAGVNILTSLFMVGGTILVALLQGLGADEPDLLIGLGALNAAVALWLFRALPGVFRSAN